jgi:hypothetical protein
LWDSSNPTLLIRRDRKDFSNPTLRLPPLLNNQGNIGGINGELMGNLVEGLEGGGLEVRKTNPIGARI